MTLSVPLLALLARPAVHPGPPHHHLRHILIAVGFALASATAYGVGTALQHRTAAAHPDLPVAGLMARLVRSPQWLLGFATDGLGLVLQAIALRNGPLLLVQAVLPLGIVLALALGGVDGPDGAHATPHRHRLTAKDWLASAAVVAGIAGLIVIGHPRGPVGGGVPERALARLLGGAALLALGAVVLGGRRPPVQRAGILGAAAGVLFAVNGAALKGAAQTDGLLDLATRWQTFAWLGGAVVGNLITQRAFQAGPLSASLPPMSAAEPLAAIAIGLLAFDERLRTGSLARVGEVAAVGLLVAGVVALSRAAGEIGAVGPVPDAARAAPGPVATDEPAERT